MKLDNIWNGLLAFIVMMAISYFMYPVLESMIGMAEVETRIFLGVLTGLVVVTMIFWSPIEITIADDKGEIN